MNRWLGGLVAFLLIVPVLAIGIAGGIAMWSLGWYFYLWWLLPVCWGVAFLLLRNVRKQVAAKEEALKVWTPRDEAAWKIVQEEARAAAKWPEDKLAVADTYVKTVRELAEKLARHYHPDAADPIEGLTQSSEIFTAIELALAGTWPSSSRTGVRGSHLCSPLVGSRLLSKAPKWYNLANNAIWAVSAVFNPASVATRVLRLEVRRHADGRSDAPGNVIAWFYSSFASSGPACISSSSTAAGSRSAPTAGARCRTR